MRDTLYNLIAVVVIMTLAIAVTFGLISMGKRWHAAEACREDEAWIAVDYRTEGAFQDSHGVTRACVNVEEIK